MQAGRGTAVTLLDTATTQERDQLPTVKEPGINGVYEVPQVEQSSCTHLL
jgi:hypothetical protein